MLIGSRAIAYWNPDFKIRANSDWDIIGSSGSYSEQVFRDILSIPKEDRIELHHPSHLNNAVLIDMFNVWEDQVCSPYGLAVMYRSHLHRDHNWDAHITKYHKFILPLLENDLHLSDPVLLERIKLTKK